MHAGRRLSFAIGPAVCNDDDRHGSGKVIARSCHHPVLIITKNHQTILTSV